MRRARDESMGRVKRSWLFERILLGGQWEVVKEGGGSFGSSKLVVHNEDILALAFRS